MNEPIQTNAKYLLTDSRFVNNPEQSIFFAIKGERHDGHDFIEELYKKGVREFVVEVPPLLMGSHNGLWGLGATVATGEVNLASVKFHQVQNSTRALQDLVAEHRKKFDIPIIGITGSNGKTIVKEWLNALLISDYDVVKSPRSYNSQIGVPLSVWQINERHTLGIFEAGISKQNEMEFLEPVIRPTIGIFTNIGSAHDEGFRSRKQKISEKLRLFRRSETLIYCKDYEEIEEEIQLLLKAVNPKIKLIGWSKKENNDFCVNVSKSDTYTDLEINFEGKKHGFRINFTDDASIENAVHCFFTKLFLSKNYSNKTTSLSIGEGLGERLVVELKPISMRLELKEGINDCYLIDDTYNNDFGGLTMALNFMSQQPKNKDKILIISDVLQSGLKENELYTTISELIKSKKITQIIGIGEVISRNKSLFVNGIFYDSTEDFLQKHPINQFRNQLILVKGARPYAFERIINRLMLKLHGTVFEINLDALTNNLNFYRSKIGQKTKIMVMVKAHAYGSGSAEVASLLEYHRVDYLGVAYTDEGISLRQNGIKLPIMVLNPQPETFDKLIEYNLEPEIYSFKILNSFLFCLNSPPLGAGRPSQRGIHLKLDTGMHRLGFEEKDLDELIEKLKANPAIKIASIFSHLVGADESEHNDFSKSQIEKFERMSEKIMQLIDYRNAEPQPLRHICNSAGIIRFPEAKFDMVRLGIGLYGIEATGNEQHSLQTVGTLKTVISQIKTLKKDETIGYGRKGILEKDSQIATIAIGYADGFDRGFSKGIGKVLVNGVLCPVVGNVCMDMTMIDVTNAKCEEGDGVIIFGKELSINDLAGSINTIPYEILTGIGERVKRIFVKE